MNEHQTQIQKLEDDIETMRRARDLAKGLSEIRISKGKTRRANDEMKEEAEYKEEHERFMRWKRDFESKREGEKERLQALLLAEEKEARDKEAGYDRDIQQLLQELQRRRSQKEFPKADECSDAVGASADATLEGKEESPATLRSRSRTISRHSSSLTPDLSDHPSTPKTARPRRAAAPREFRYDHPQIAPDEVYDEWYRSLAGSGPRETSKKRKVSEE